jgi:transposase
MTKATTIGLDIAKQVFQVHRDDKADRRVFRRNLRWSRVVGFFSGAVAARMGIEVSALYGACVERVGHKVLIWRRRL